MQPIRAKYNQACDFLKSCIKGKKIAPRVSKEAHQCPCQCCKNCISAFPQEPIKVILVQVKTPPQLLLVQAYYLGKILSFLVECIQHLPF